jgi:hypothetical protein
MLFLARRNSGHRHGEGAGLMKHALFALLFMMSFGVLAAPCSMKTPTGKLVVVPCPVPARTVSVSVSVPAQAAPVRGSGCGNVPAAVVLALAPRCRIYKPLELEHLEVIVKLKAQVER